MPVFRTASEEETIALGERLAHLLPRGATVLLIGNLGAGKTTLAKGIVKGLGAAPVEEVSSPTFTLIHEYGTPPVVYHVDLYRLETAREAATLGLDDLFDSPAMALIEWGERFPELMPAERVEIRLRALEGDVREVTVGGPGTRYPEIMDTEDALQAPDASHALDMVTLFSSSAMDAEMEVMSIHAILQANGIQSVVVGSTPYPVLDYQVQVPREDLETARRILAEAEAAGPAAADEAEAASEEGV